MAETDRTFSRSDRRADAPLQAPRRGRSPWARIGLTGWIYAAPTALVVGFLFLSPIGLAGWMSLHRWPLLGVPRWNFPANYAAIPNDPLAMQGIGFTLSYTAIITVILLSLGLGLALLIQESGPGVGLFRTAFFLPASIGLTASALLFYGLYAPSIGPLNPLMQSVGLISRPIDWLGTPRNALMSTVIMMTWRFAGFYMLIMLTGLQAIAREIYEAARIDGADRLQIFRHVTLPLLRPTIALCLVLMISGAMLAFEQFYVLTKGGPDNSTVTIVMAMFRQAFTRFDVGRAAALGTVLLAALVVLNSVQLWIARRNEA